MANDFYKFYRESNMRLAKTMVIKSEVSALATNRYLTQLGVPVSTDKRTWRYYMNIAGLYHSNNKAMQVLSLDTNEMIDFTVENLKVHRATARGYAYGSSYCAALINKYPDNESLILGVLNPVDQTSAIDAKEGEILWMDGSLVEPNEDNLKELIQRQINAFLDRWHVEMYSYTEDLYDGIRLAILYANLPCFIEVARMKNSRTFRSHSFHVRQFLASNGRLDRFMDAMTLQQRLFFYRNLHYLHRYPGWQDSFDWLVENVMEVRGLPLADYTLTQNISNMPDAVTPGIELIRRETTRAYQGTPETSATVLEVLEKQLPLARENDRLLDDNLAETTALMELSKVSQLQTKVLESKVLDLTDSDIFNLQDFLISHWMYLAVEGRYRTVVTITHPRTGGFVQLPALDAFILFIYSYNLAIDKVLEVVPVMVASRVLKSPVPTPASMLALADPTYASMEMAEALWDLIPTLDYYVSTESFYDAVAAVHSGAVAQYNLASYNGNFNIRANAEIMSDHMFMDIPVDLSEGSNIAYLDWLRARGLEEVAEFGKVELEELWKSLLSITTGMALNHTLKLSDVHKAMVGIMGRMSSYSVHYIREINEQPLKPLTNRFIRIGDVEVSEHGVHEIDIIGHRDIKGAGTHRSAHELYSDLGLDIIDQSASVENTAFFEIGAKLEEQCAKANQSSAAFSFLKFMEPEFTAPVDLSAYDAVSDIVVGPLGAIDVDLADVLTVTTLYGLNYPKAL